MEIWTLWEKEGKKKERECRVYIPHFHECRLAVLPWCCIRIVRVVPRMRLNEHWYAKNVFWVFPSDNSWWHITRCSSCGDRLRRVLHVRDKVMYTFLLYQWSEWEWLGAVIDTLEPMLKGTRLRWRIRRDIAHDARSILSLYLYTV